MKIQWNLSVVGKLAVGVASAVVIASCQSSGTNTLNSSDASVSEPVNGSDVATNTSLSGANNPVETANLACNISLAAGPPPKPAKGKDFGKAVVANTGKAAGRGLIRNLGSRFGGQLGGLVAGSIADTTVRNEEDIKGTWMITDTSQNCGCSVWIDSPWKLQGKGNDKGSAKPQSCGNPNLQQMAHWALGYSFTGYDAKFEFKAKNRKTVVATLNRDGIHYFSGTLSDGTPVVMWREKQNYITSKKQ